MGAIDRGVREIRRLAVRAAGEQRAQGTLEYALVFCMLLAIVLGLAATWKAGEQGLFARLVEDAASHGLDPLGVLDILLY